MSEGNTYMDLPQRIAEAFPEIDSDIVIDFSESNEEYAALHRKAYAMKQKYPFINKVIEGKGEIALSADEHKVLVDYLGLKFRLDCMERQQPYFRGHSDCIAYLKKVGAL